MRRIAVINQKGGVGKTTTTVNLGAALARLGQRVLICDLDPQCNLTVHVDVDPTEEPSVYNLLRGEATLEQAVRPTREQNLWVLPSSVDLAGVELELVNTVGREVILRDAFETLERSPGAPHWDVVLVDCPPSLGLLSLNALVLCDEVLVPVQSEFFALQGLSKLTEIVDLVQRRLNPRLRVTGLLSCRHDSSTNLGRQVMDDIRKHFGDVLLRSAIRRNVKLAEAPSHGKTIFEYDAESRGAEDYLALARELLGEAAPAPAKASAAKSVPVAPAPVLKLTPPKPVVAPPVVAAKVEAPKPAIATAPMAKSAASARPAVSPKPVVAATSVEPVKLAPTHAKPVASKPMIAKSEIAKPAIAKPLAPAPIVAKPALAKADVAKPIEPKPAAAKAALAPKPGPPPAQATRVPAQPTVPLTPRALAEAKRAAAAAVPVPPRPAAPAKPAAAQAKAAAKAPAAIQQAATPAPAAAKPAEPARSAAPSAPTKPAATSPASNGATHGATNGATNGHAPAGAAAAAPRPAVAPAASAPDPLAPAPRRPARRVNRPSTESTSQDP